MRDFDIKYTDWITLTTVISPVYAVDAKQFLIYNNMKDKFEWVPMDDCKLERVVLGADEEKGNGENHWHRPGSLED